MQSSATSSTEAVLESGNIAIIGGTGFERLPPDMFAENIIVETSIGDVPVLSVSNNYVEPYKLYFLSRHGGNHGIAPHQINYRANITALRMLDVKHVFATNAVGSLRCTLQPGDLVVMDDFIDFTRNRHLTIFEEGGNWNHTDFSQPYSRNLKSGSCESRRYHWHFAPYNRSVPMYCVDGPRFESPAEVRLFAAWGADVVGMTGLPEAVFAREANINYAAVGIVTNLAAGLSLQPVSHSEVVKVMESQVPAVRELLLETCSVIRRQQDS